MSQLDLIDSTRAKQAIATINQVQTAMKNAFNPKLGMMDNRVLISQLNNIKGGFNQIYKSMSLAGTQGLNAFTQLYGQVHKIDTGMKQVSSTTDKIANTISNTFRWGVIASVFSQMMNGLHQSVQYVKDLDESLTNIMMVSGTSRDAMNEYAKAANDAAKALGSTTVGMTNATQVFVQQGYDLGVSQQLAKSSVVLGNISQQDTATASDEITAYMNAFKININDLNNALSKWAIVANVSAADVQELSIASQKAASAAVTTGVNMDQLAAQIATIETVTREAPENIGNGLKTLYARFSDIKMGETLEDGVDLGKVTSTLQSVGVQVLNAEGNMREVGDIMEDLMDVWGGLDLTQKNAIGQTLAGKFQYTRFSALMNRSDLYKQYLAASKGETGTQTFDMMQGTYEESMQGRLNKLQATIEGTFSNLFDTDDFYGLIDTAQTLANAFDELTKAVGDGQIAIIGLASFITKHFSENIGRGIANTINNAQQARMLKSNQQAVKEQSLLTLQGKGLNPTDNETQSLAIQIAKASQHAPQMNSEQRQKNNDLIDQRVAALNKEREAQERVRNAIIAASAARQLSSGEMIQNEEELLKFVNDLKLLDAEIKPGDLEKLGFGKISEEIFKATKSLDGFLGMLRTTKKGTVTFVDGVDWTQFQEGAVKTKKELQEILKIRNLPQESVEKINTAIGELTKAEDGEIRSLDDFRKKINSTTGSLKEYRNIIIDAMKSANLSNEEIRQMVAQMAAAGEEAEATKGAFAGWIEQMETQALATNITNAVAGIGQLAFAVQSFQQIGSIWSSDDLTLGEKWLQTIINATMAIPMFTSGVKDAFVGVGALTKAITEQWTARKASTATEAEDVVAKELEKTATEQAAEAEEWKAKADGEGAISNGEDAAGSLADAEAKEVEAGATNAAATANRGFWASFGPGLIILAGITAAIAVATIAIKALYEEYNKDAIAAEKTSKAAAKLQEEYTNLQSTYENLTQKMADYHDAVAGLNELQKGTEEWDKQLQKVNSTVLDLLEAYPQLAQYVSTTADGQLKISEQGSIEFEKAQKNALESAKIAATQASISASDAQVQADKTNLRRSINWVDTNVVANQFSGGNNVPISRSLSEADFDKIAKAYQKNGAQAINKPSEIANLLGTDVTNPMVTAISSNIDKIIKFLEKESNNEAKDDIASDQMLTSYLKSQGKYNENDLNANKIVSTLTDKYYEPEYEKQKKQYEDSKDKEKLRGDFESTDQASGLSFKKWDGDSAIYVDKKGTEHTYTKEMMIDVAASAKAMDEAAKHWEEVANLLKGVAETAFGKENNGFQESATSGFKDSSGEEHFDYSKMSTKALKRSLDEENKATSIEQLGLTEDFVKQSGFVDEQGNADGAAYIAAYYAGAQEELNKRQNIQTIITTNKDSEGNEYYNQGDMVQKIETRDDKEFLTRSYTNDTQEYQEQADKLIEQADNVYQLEALWQNNFLATKEYQKGLIELGSTYSDLKPEVDAVTKAQEKYEKALESKDTEQITEATLELVDAQEDLKDAVATKEWSKLREQLQDSLSVLEDENASAEELSKTYNTVADSLSDLTGLDVTSDWIKESEENKQAIIDWLNNVEGAGAKLDALLNLDFSPQRDQFIQVLDDMDIEYQAVRDQIANEDISFDINGHADFSQVTGAMEALGISSDDTTSQLQFLAAYLNALGGASLEMTNTDGDIEKIAAPDMTGSPEEVTAAMNEWMSDIQSKLAAHFSFTGIDLPDSPMEVPTHSTGSSSGSGGSSGSSGGKSGGGGKGGGGGSGKSYEPKQKEYESKEKDRYEKVNTALDEIDSQLNQITMDQDRLIGTRAIDNLKKETDLLKEQIPWYQQKLEIQKEEAKELRDQLSSDFGAQFGANGQLQNYSNIFDQLEKERKAAYDRYNAETTEEGQEAAEEAIKQIEDRQAAFEKLYSRYDTLWSKDIPDTEKALKEIQDRLEDIAEEAFKARREAAQMLNDMRETARDTEQTFQNLFGEHPEINFNLSMKSIDEIIGGPELEANLAKYITDYENKLSQATDKNMKQYYQSQISALKRVQANGGNGLLAFNENRLAEVMRMWNEWQKTGSYTIEGQVSTNEQALLDLMKEAVEDGNDLMSNLSSAISDAMDNMEALGEIMDSEIENQLNGMDAINDKIEHQQNMIELIYGDQASAAQIQLLNRQAEVEENRVGILEKQLDIQKQATATAKEMYETDLAAHEGKVNQDLLEKYLDALDQERDIDNQILETREKIAQSYKDAKEAANDLAVDNWLTNFQGQLSDNGPFVPLEYMADQWERIQENEELYLDDLNKAYEIQKLSNKYQEMLNDATDPKIQQQITDQMREQLAYLNEKTNLSKYDVDYANAQLEILQKTIALEDARAAKNQMKLRRDSQGNYQYVYAADQNQTAEAENDLLDASMNAYNMSKEQQADVQDSYIKKVQDMADALRKAANDATLDEEQIAAITQDIIDKGHEYLEAMGEQLNTSQKNMISSFIDAAFQLQEEYASGVRNIAEELQENTSRGLDDVDDRFDTSVNNWVDGEDAIREQSNKTRENIINNINNFTDAVTEANLAVVDPLGEIQSGIDGIDDSIVRMKDDMSDLYNTLDQQTGAFANAGADVEALQEKLTDANNALSKYSRDLQAANDKIQELQTVNTGLTAQLNGGSDSGDGSGSGGSGSSPDAGEIEPGDQYRYIGGLYYYDSYGSTPVGDRGPGGIVTVEYTNFGAPYPIAVKSDDSAYGWLRPDQLVKLKSGGYTGEWGEDGRMAMLHEKELVLNSTDTQNILAAVDAVRMITEQLKGSAFINNIGSSIGRAAQNNLQGNNVEQRVEITANFPNVNSAEEIERALLNISDRSYQYAYNKNDIPW